MSTTDELVTAQTGTTWAVLGPMNGQDIEAIAFLVLMQAAKSAQEDLKAIMEQVKKINEEKQALRKLLSKEVSRMLLKERDGLTEFQLAALIRYLHHPC